MKSIYKIKVLNWERHNPKSHKSFKKTLIANNFCTDNKLGVLPLSHRWLFLGILLTCGNEGKDTVEMSGKQVRALLESSKSIEGALSALQSIQVLTFERSELHLNTIEVNGIEVNRSKKKNNRREGKDQEPSQATLLPAVAAPLHDFILLWNEKCGPLSKVKNSNPSRDRKIKVLWTQQKPDGWTATIEKITASNFCTGKNDRGWKATFDWLLQPETWLKVNEGKYDNNPNGSGPNTRSKLIYDNLDRMEQQLTQKGSPSEPNS